jgi:hypothetical protein
VDGIAYVATNEPPDPVSVNPMTTPPIPYEPYSPIVTLKLSSAGKLYAWIVTDWSATTCWILKYGYEDEFELDAATGNANNDNAIRVIIREYSVFMIASV